MMKKYIKPIVMTLGGLLIACLLALGAPGAVHAAPQFAIPQEPDNPLDTPCLLYTSDAADE